MTYTDADLQNLSRSNDELVRTIAARYYVERGDLRTKLADAEKRDPQMRAIVDAAIKWRKARWDLPDAQLSGDPKDETAAFALYDTAIRELQKAVSELEQP